MFAMDHSNVSFVSLGDGLVASTRQVAFDGATCLSCDSSRILSGGACVAAGEVMAKVQDGDPGWVRVCGLQGMVLPERDGVCRMHCTPRDVQPQRRRRVVRRTARLALFDDNADHTRRATQPAARRDADVAPVVNAHDRAGIAKHMSALMSLAVASSRSYPARKTGVVVLLSLAFVAR